MDLFEENYLQAQKRNAPLADRIRPSRMDDVVGQEHLLGPGMPLREAIQKDVIPSMILAGPPGSGKTTIARLTAAYTKSELVSINAVIDGIPRIKEVIKEATEQLKLYHRRTILFIDEIHRFNKTQQDALLPYLENGLIVLIGATTENPFVELNKALISRLMLFRLHKITDQDIRNVLEKTLKDKENGFGKYSILFDDKDRILGYLIHIAGGDLRKSLNALEQLVNITPMSADGSLLLTLERAEELIREKSLNYDKNGDTHYDVISAFIKSIRGSDPDAAIHYLARMISGGEDPMFIARRMILLAAEDIGLADPSALNLAVSCAQAIQLIGLPEGRIPMSETAIYLANAPKSNSAYLAIDQALGDIESMEIGEVPEHLRSHHEGNAPYLYPHDYPEQDYKVEQQYLPTKLMGQRYYHPKKSDR